jgi:hypothetical protein
MAHPMVDVNQSDPLYIASQFGHTQTVGLLLAHPAIDVNKASAPTGSTALFIA